MEDDWDISSKGKKGKGGRGRGKQQAIKQDISTGGTIFLFQSFVLVAEFVNFFPEKFFKANIFVLIFKGRLEKP